MAGSEPSPRAKSSAEEPVEDVAWSGHGEAAPSASVPEEDLIDAFERGLRERRKAPAPDLKMSVFVVDGEAYEALREMAETRGTSQMRVMGNALALQRYLSAAVRQGGKVLIEKPDGTFSQVVLP